MSEYFIKGQNLILKKKQVSSLTMKLLGIAFFLIFVVLVASVSMTYYGDIRLDTDVLKGEIKVHVFHYVIYQSLETSRALVNSKFETFDKLRETGLWLILGTSLIILFDLIRLMTAKLIIAFYEGERHLLKQTPFFQRILDFSKVLFSPKNQKEIFEPIIADWQEEYFEALFKKEIWKARWINVRYTYAFLAAMWMKSPIGDLIQFVIKIAKP